MNVQETLNNYEVLFINAQAARQRLDDFKRRHDDLIGSKAINMDGMPHGSNISNPTESSAIKLVDRLRQLEREYEEELKAETEALNKIHKMIHSLKNAQQIIVLEERYIHFKPIAEISYDERIDKSISQTRRYHDQGIRALERKYKNA